MNKIGITMGEGTANGSGFYWNESVSEGARLLVLKSYVIGSADRLSEYDESNSELHEGSYSGVEGYHIWVISDQIKRFVEECKTGNLFQAKLSLASIDFHIERIQTMLEHDRNLYSTVYTLILAVRNFSKVYKDGQAKDRNATDTYYLDRISGKLKSVLNRVRWFKPGLDPKGESKSIGEAIDYRKNAEES